MKKKPVSSILETKFFNEWMRWYPQYRPAREYRFAKERAYRFDFAWPEHHIAVEIQGWGPGHQSRKGITRDHNKNNLALQYGWRVFYFNSTHLSVRNIRHTINSVALSLRIPNAVSERKPGQYLDFVKRRRRS